MSNDSFNIFNQHNVSTRPLESPRPITRINIETNQDKYPYFGRVHAPVSERPFVCHEDDVKFITNFTDMYNKK